MQVDSLWTARHLIPLANQAKMAIEGNVHWPEVGGHTQSRLKKELDRYQPLTESASGLGSEPDDIHWKVMLERGQPCFKNETARPCSQEHLEGANKEKAMSWRYGRDICVHWLDTQDEESYVWVPELNPCLRYCIVMKKYCTPHGEKAVWQALTWLQVNATEFDEAYSVSHLWEAGERAEIVITKSFII